MGGTDFKGLPEIPETVANANRMLACNRAHLGRLLKRDPYPGCK